MLVIKSVECAIWLVDELVATGHGRRLTCLYLYAQQSHAAQKRYEAAERAALRAFDVDLDKDGRLC